MPQDVVDYLTKNHWGHMHLDFHVGRLWDTLAPSTQHWAADQGISRARLQEGEKTTGLEFLAMHRLMLDDLRNRFPEQADLFAGWQTVPTDPRDPSDPLPHGSVTSFDADMTSALDRLERDVAGFASDDDFALFLQTKRRPTADDPRAVTDDASAGIHNYLHVRFTDRTSSVNVGDPAVNLSNRVFWRIHGWIDARWTAYRKAKGLDDATDPVYLKAMSDAQAWMDDVMARAMADGKSDDGCMEPAPDEVKNLFSE
jgi:hypothetical protein